MRRAILWLVFPALLLALLIGCDKKENPTTVVTSTSSVLPTTPGSTLPPTTTSHICDTCTTTTVPPVTTTTTAPPVTTTTTVPPVTTTTTVPPVTTTTTESECRDHEWDEGVYTTECGAVGETLYTCLICGGTKLSYDAEPTEHSYEGTPVDGDCKHTAGTSYLCTRCGDEYFEADESYVYPDHEYEETSHTDATCYKQGCTVYTCTVCGDVLEEEEEGPLPPHNFATEFTTDRPASTSNPGEKSRHCTNEGCTARTDVTEIPKVVPDLPWQPFG